MLNRYFPTLLRVALATLVAVLSLVDVHAWIPFYVDNGSLGGPFPLDGSSIVLERESVHVTLSAGIDRYGRPHLTYDVFASYTMVNPGDESLFQAVGFPVVNTKIWVNRDLPEHDNWRPPAGSETLRVRIDGVDTSLNEASEATLVSFDYHSIQVADVAFEPGQRRVIEVSFQQRDYGSISVPVFYGSGNFNFRYVRDPIAKWSGSTGTVEVVLRVVAPQDLLEVAHAEPGEYQVQQETGGSVLVWERQNLTTSSDLHVEFTTSVRAEEEFRQVVEPMIEARDLTGLGFAAHALLSNSIIVERAPADIVRQVFFWAGNDQYFRSDLPAAMYYFSLSFLTSYLPLIDRSLEQLEYMSGTPPRGDMAIAVNLLPVRPPGEAPEYFAAFNLAGIHSRIAADPTLSRVDQRRALQNAHDWLQIARSINAEVIEPMIAADPDLEFYRRNFE